jgi:integrase/recombinase XerD
MKNFINEYLQKLKEKKYKFSTIKAYKYLLNSFYEFLIKQNICSYKNLNKKIVLKFINHIQEHRLFSKKKILIESAKLKTHRLNKFLKYLSQKKSINFLILEKKDLKNIFKNFSSSHINLSKIEKLRLLNSIDTSRDLGIRDRAMIELVLNIKIKKHKLLELKTCDLNIKKNKIYYKNIILNNNATKYLFLYLNNVRPLLLNDSKEKTLFLSLKGYKINKYTAIDILKKYIHKAGIKKHITWNTLCKTK